jgi:hypothetical protein
MWRNPYGQAYESPKSDVMPPIEWENPLAHPQYYIVDESTKKLVKASALRFQMMVTEG